MAFLGRLNRALGAGRHIKQPQPVNGSGGPIGPRGNPLLRAVEDVAIASGKPQPAWAPANEVATGAIQKRGYRAVVSAQRDLIAKGQPADQRRLRRAGIAVNADARLYITFDINLNRNRPKVVGFGRTELSQKSTGIRRLRAQILNVDVIADRAMRVAAVKITEPGAVRIDLIEVESVALGLAGIVPAAKYDGAFVRYQWVQIVALVERDLLDVVPVSIHHVQDKGRNLALLVKRRILGLALVQQNRARHPLPRGGKDNAVIRQVSRRDILPCFGGDVGFDNAPESAGRYVVLPDVPGWLFVLIRVFNLRRPHGKENASTIVRDGEILDVVAKRPRKSG